MTRPHAAGRPAKRRLVRAVCAGLLVAALVGPVPGTWAASDEAAAPGLASPATSAPAAAQAAPSDPQAMGALRGAVADKDTGAPLAGARVTIAELRLGARSGEDGRFLLPRVPPGTWTVTVALDGYEKRSVAEVAVPAGRVAEVRVDLPAEVLELDEMVVSGGDFTDSTAPGILEVRAAAASVQDALSAEMIARSGAGDVAGALKQVVGASIVDGKYATVRGLSDRYTGTTLNGIRIPSADPRRRAAQMDLFPTGTIEDVTVTKTFTPDQQGDFTGGGVDMRTRVAPAERILSVTTSTEHNTIASGNDDFLTYADGGVDRLARPIDARALPAAAGQPLPAFPTFNTTRPSAQQIEASERYDVYTRAFAPVIGSDRDAPQADQGISILAGDRLPLPSGAVVGLVGAFTQSYKHTAYEDAANNSAVVSDPQQGITLTRPRIDAVGVEESLASALGSAVVQITPAQTVTLQILRNRSSEDATRFQVLDRGYPAIEQNQSLHYVERDVRSTQIRGSHALGGGESGAGAALLGWSLARNATTQDEPDVRFFRNWFDLSTLTATMPSNSTDAQNTRRIFRDIAEDDDQASADLTLPLALRHRGAGSLKFGAFAEKTDRAYDQSSYTYTFPNQLGSFLNPDTAANRALAQFNADSPEDLWTDVFLDPARIGLATNTPPAPNQLLWSLIPLGDDVDYTGRQDVKAAYAMADLPLTGRLRAVGGARFETTRVQVTPANRDFGTVQTIEVLDSGDRAIVSVPDDAAATDIADRTWLPSVGLVLEARPGLYIRGSYSRTLARPTFREIAPVATEEFIFGDEFIGNPGLALSKITNYDLRAEWFPMSGAVLAASVFAKSIADPIELISFSAGGRTFVQPINFDSGRVRGVEIEARAPLGALSPRLQPLAAGVNVTFIDSSVEIPAAEQRSLASFGLDQETRRLQGQPAYLVNADLIWTNRRARLTSGLFYNLVGETVVSGAARGSEDGNPDVYQEKFGTLDLKVTREFLRGLRVSFTAKNVLTPTRRSVYRTPEGEEATKTSQETAAIYGVAVGYAW